MTMAQANLAQREPSMEEILASIRRIIEDSDTVRKTLPEDEPERDAASLRAEAANTQTPEPVEVQAFRQELRGTTASPARAEPAFEEAPSEEEGSEPDAMELEAAFAAMDVTEAPAPIKPPQAAAARQERVAGPAEPKPAAVEPKPAISPVASAPAADKTEERRPAIISDAAGRQVAAAFEELSAAFSASRSRSFDEMAEEMMRPMLQDWLDNNLPTLVERLVREEIERIARGGAA